MTRHTLSRYISFVYRFLVVSYLINSVLCVCLLTAFSLRYSKRRANWKWASDRGAIASRWMWLIAQVADLEFKIRQQNELYRTLRHSKGQIILEANIPTPIIKEIITPTVTSLTPTEKTVLPLAPAAGEIDSSVNKTSVNAISDNTIVNEVNCVRTLPVKPIRKRKLVHSVNALSGATRKIARFSTLHCSCSSLPSSVAPCVLCSGRHSYTQVIDTDCMHQYDRVALLDPSFHPVLSLPNSKYYHIYD